MFVQIAVGTALLVVNITLAAVAAMVLEVLFLRFHPWLMREPRWWLSVPTLRLKREPLQWKKYRAWMELVRHPIQSREEWLAKFGEPDAG